MLANIKSGDHVSFHCPRLKCSRTRAVKTVLAEGVLVLHGGERIVIEYSNITSVTAKESKGRTELSQLMYHKGVRNEDAAEKSGYSVGTIDRARRGLRVKPRTLADILETIKSWK
jgi:uncharacterized protein YerC